MKVCEVRNKDKAKRKAIKSGSSSSSNDDTKASKTTATLETTADAMTSVSAGSAF